MRSGVTSLRDRLRRYWNDLPSKAMSEGFGELQTFKAPAVSLPLREASRPPSALNAAAVPTQLVHVIKAASEAAVRRSNMGDE